MLSPADTVLIFVVALLLFGPEQVPKIARQLGEAMRHVQNSTSAFMAEMDRAAAATESKNQPVWEPPAAWELKAGDGTTTQDEETPATAQTGVDEAQPQAVDEPTPPSQL